MTRTLHVAEPPAIYLMRTPLVVDCSVLSAALFREASRAVALERLHNKILHAPHLLDFEIVSVAHKKLRMGGSPQDSDHALKAYAEFVIELHRCDIAAVLDLAHRYRLSTYDAAYLWLSAEMKAPLATFDDKLAAAAKVHLAGLA